jgi:fused signal recognition particle receptor
VNTVELIILVSSAVASGVGLTLLGVLIEFSVRKRAAVEAAPHEAAEVQAPPQVPPPAAEVPPPPAPERPLEAHPPAAAVPAAPPAAKPVPPAAVPEVKPPEVAPPPPEVAAPPAEVAPPPAPSAPAAPVSEAAAAATVTPLARFRLGLRKTRESFWGHLRGVMGGGAKADEIYDSLEEALIGADVGVDTSGKVVAAVRSRVKGNPGLDAIREALKEEITSLLAGVERKPAQNDSGPLVVMLVGVNGAGKTTTIAKLAAQFKAERGAVVVAAGDTFRAAAIEQLEVWCQRVGAEIIKQKQGSDPAAVAFDAVKSAKARKVPTVLIDTAGRLQTKINLMEELKKIARVIGRELPGAPHETWLVLDATTGQNALSQAKIFADAVPLTGVVLAKLDSTAKGGVIVAIADRLKLPVRFVGIGEEVADLRPFDGREFAEALFAGEDGAAAAGKSYAA